MSGMSQFDATMHPRGHASNPGSFSHRDRSAPEASLAAQRTPCTLGGYEVRGFQTHRRGMEGGGFSASVYRGGANMLTDLTTKGRHQGPEITRLVTTAEQVYGPDVYAPDERFVILVLANADLDDAGPEQWPAAVEAPISQMLADGAYDLDDPDSVREMDIL